MGFVACSTVLLGRVTGTGTRRGGPSRVGVTLLKWGWGLPWGLPRDRRGLQPAREVADGVAGARRGHPGQALGEDSAYVAPQVVAGTGWKKSAASGIL